MSIDFDDRKMQWMLRTAGTCYALCVDNNGTLQHRHWGAPIRSDDLPQAQRRSIRQIDEGDGIVHEEFPLVRYLWESTLGVIDREYPGWGGIAYREPALKVRFADGVRDLDLRFHDAEVIGETGEPPSGHSQDPEASGTAGAETLAITLVDRHYGLEVTLYYRPHPAYDIIERWAAITNRQSEPVSIEHAASAVWHLPRGDDYRLSYLSGHHLGETQFRQQRVEPGTMLLESRRGETSHHYNPFFMLDNGDAGEEHGAVWFGELAWSGNWRLAVERTNYDQLAIIGGVNNFDFEWLLAPGESFRTPPCVAGFTQHGFGAASRLLHRYQREMVLPSGHRNAERKVLYNSWEATNFNVTEAGQIALAETAAKLGVERFVIDDGWFGARNSDAAGLGDWEVNREKFPNGLSSLIERVHALGMDFGLWVEPEMVNRESNLFRLHPEWTYHFPTRQSSESRNQLVLNLAIPAVEEFILRTLDDLLHRNDIAFVKWDFNRNISEPGWPDAPKGREKEVWVRHVEAFYRIVETLRERHPQVSFEACAGGGARVDLGTLSRFDQFWPSDNTDPVDRLLIQDGYSYAYCAKAMMSWVTDSPNFVNGRATPLSFRFAVAMMGSLGIGCDLNRLSGEELEECAHWIARYKQIRATVQEGDLYRLHSPRHGPIAATQYVTRDGTHSVLFVTLTGGHFAHELPVVRLYGLNEEARYSVEGFAEPKSGAYLMHLGIRFRLRGGDYQSVVSEVARLD